MSCEVDEDTQGTVNSLCDAIHQRDALLSFYFLELLAAPEALALPASETRLNALETAVAPPAVNAEDAPAVLERLRNAHLLILKGTKPSLYERRRFTRVSKTG
ncbi:hypothetical protein RQP46_006762 [Phenoliferia psychrophenolica]